MFNCDDCGRTDCQHYAWVDGYKVEERKRKKAEEERQAREKYRAEVKKFEEHVNSWFVQAVGDHNIQFNELYENKQAKSYLLKCQQFNGQVCSVTAYAASKGRLDIVKDLVRMGMNPEGLNGEVLRLATLNNHTHVTNYIQNEIKREHLVRVQDQAHKLANSASQHARMAKLSAATAEATIQNLRLVRVQDKVHKLANSASQHARMAEISAATAEDTIQKLKRHDLIIDVLKKASKYGDSYLRVYSDENQNSLLVLAAKEGDFKTIRFLVKTIQVPIDSYNKNQETALHCAASRGDSEIVKFLVNYGANIHMKTKGAKGLRTAEQLASPSLAKDVMSLLHVRGLYEKARFFLQEHKNDAPHAATIGVVPSLKE